MVSFSPAARASACSATRQRSCIEAKRNWSARSSNSTAIWTRFLFPCAPIRPRIPLGRAYPLIVDSVTGEGPVVGIRSAFAAHPNVAWLVLACDLPFLSEAAIEGLLRRRDPGALATAYISAHDGLPEPLCAIWEPAAAPSTRRIPGRRRHLSAKIPDPPRRAFARSSGCARPRQRQYARGILQALAALETSAPMQLKIQYYALMREQAGRSEETLRNLGGDAGGSLRRTRRALRLHAVARAIEGGGQQRVQRLVAQARRQ